MKLGERANSGLHESLLGRLPGALKKDDPILDVGCGTGAWLARLHAEGFTDLTGIDRIGSRTQHRKCKCAQNCHADGCFTSRADAHERHEPDHQREHRDHRGEKTDGQGR